MTNQLQGELLFAGIASTDPVVTPWMPVRGNIATFGVEITVVNGVTVTWNVETRSLEDPSTVTALFATAPSRSTVGVSIATSSSVLAKQLVRYKVWTGGTSSTSNWVQVRALVPSWQSDR